jgi:hypothetical protein
MYNVTLIKFIIESASFSFNWRFCDAGAAQQQQEQKIYL